MRVNYHAIADKESVAIHDTHIGYACVRILISTRLERERESLSDELSRGRESLLGKPSRAREGLVGINYRKVQPSKNPALLSCTRFFEIASLKYENYCPWLRSVSLAPLALLVRFFILQKLPSFLRRDPRTTHRQDRPRMRER